MSRRLKWKEPTKTYTIRIPEYIAIKVKEHFGSIQAMVDFLIKTFIK